MRHSIRFALAALFVLCSTAVGHTVPQVIGHSGVLLDGVGQPVTVTTSMEFRIWSDDSPLAVELWFEPHLVTPDADGLYNVQLGSTNPIPDSALTTATPYLGMTIPPDPEMAPRTRLLAVPFARRVATVDGAEGGTITSKVSIGPGHVNTGDQAFLAGNFNQVSANESSIGGGRLNTVSGELAVIGGGHGNSVTAYAGVIAGGNNNIVLDSMGTIGGGDLNFASGDRATISGGGHNRALGAYSTVSGGGGPSFADSNKAAGDFSTIGGGSRHLASGYATTIGGGQVNSAQGEYSAISGGVNNSATGFAVVIGGGSSNSANDSMSTVGGGGGNVVTELYGTISGGEQNSAAWYSAVGGGSGNSASGFFSTVGGGLGNSASVNYSTVAGGRNNHVNSPVSSYGTIGGGESNTIAFGASHATISGGESNVVFEFAEYGAIGGGFNNLVADTSICATIPGGSNCVAYKHAFAAGRRAKANHIGSFVWGDSFDGNVSSSASNQFTARTSGGARFFSNTALTTGVTLAAGGGAWAAVSDRSVKRNIRPVDGDELLQKIAQLEVSRWNYESQDESIEHIGPMAQDFYRLFGVGDNNTTITTIDPDGIALAAIKELTARNSDLEAGMAAQQQQIEDLRAMIEAMVSQR